MELSVRPAVKSAYPRKGMLVKGDHPLQWVEQMRQMGLPMESVELYPLPGSHANSIWGCLVVGRMPAEPGRYGFLQFAHGLLFLPEYAELYPTVHEPELQRLLSGKQHLFHPETGWVELPAAVSWKELVEPPVRIEGVVQQAVDGVVLPARVKSFLLSTAGANETLTELTDSVSDGKIVDKGPLSVWEKIKLGILWFFFPANEKTGWWGELGEWLGSKVKSKWIDKLQEELLELEERNNLEAGKLLDLFKKDPKGALKYAIPLDPSGSARGGGAGRFRLTPRWHDLSFGRRYQHSGSSRATIGGNHLTRLHKQYMDSAQDFIRGKQYKEAAFIYLRLLKNYLLAADTLEKGGLYAEAASVHLQYTQNRLKAAECYEKGKFTLQAIELYKELRNDEKTADLYMSLYRDKEARFYYDRLVGQLTESHHYVKAALICRGKMGDVERAQGLLMEGWDKNADAVNCLNAYFSNIAGQEELEMEIRRIFAINKPEGKRNKYLEVMKHQYKRHSGLEEPIRDIAFEIISERMRQQPDSASELQDFVRGDQNLVKDILRYQQLRKRMG